MLNPNVKYNVTGRYMDGQSLIGYHLVGEDGSQAQEGTARVLWLIEQGVILNMRTQKDKEKGIIPRGKGINLNNLPIYDVGKQQFRGDNKSQEAANSKVPVRKNDIDANAMGQYKILRRIMYKNTCMGYEVQDYSGAITRKKKEDVKKLALQKLISNAVANKTIKQGTNKPELVLRGVGCKLRTLPVLIVKDNGKIVDPTKEANDADLTIRVAYMKHSGIIYNENKTKKISFKTGDFIVCNAGGQISIQDRISIEKKYCVDKTLQNAVCDDYLDMCAEYIVEIFGAKPIQLTDKVVKAWVIMRPRKENV